MSNFEFEWWFLLFYTLFAIVAIAALMWVGSEGERVERRTKFRSAAKPRGEHER